MKKGFSVIGILVAISILLSYQGSSFAWQWPWKDKEKHTGPHTTWRWAGVLKNNVHAHEKCSAVCAKNKEKWTSEWRAGWVGNECQCKDESKQAKGWWKSSAEKPAAGVTYRSAGTIRSPAALATECPKVCKEHKEDYTGNWKHGWLGGYKCECQIPSRS